MGRKFQIKLNFEGKQNIRMRNFEVLTFSNDFLKFFFFGMSSSVTLRPFPGHFPVAKTAGKFQDSSGTTSLSQKFLFLAASTGKWGSSLDSSWRKLRSILGFREFLFVPPMDFPGFPCICAIPNPSLKALCSQACLERGMKHSRSFWCSGKVPLSLPVVWD